MLRLMAMRMTVLASGSRGNCTVLSSSSDSILVDAGLSCKETLKRMKAGGEDPSLLKAIVISHEHSDHVAGLDVLARKLKIPVYITEDTYHCCRTVRRDKDGRPVTLESPDHFHAGRSFMIAIITAPLFTFPPHPAAPCRL